MSHGLICNINTLGMVKNIDTTHLLFFSHSQQVYIANQTMRHEFDIPILYAMKYYKAWTRI